MKQIEQRMEKSRNPLNLNKNEMFMIRLLRMLHNNCNAKFAVTVEHTGVGQVVKAKCAHCWEEYDITDYESW